MTFSTNDPHFPEKKDIFLNELISLIEKSGFSINERKIRFSLNTQRQEVTGLVVNNKINVKREYYKTTRSMVDHIYHGMGADINGNPLSINAVEGRLAYINQLDKYDNIHREKKRNKSTLNGREREYRQFLFYKYFYAPTKPLIVTEGKTDVIYLKAAMKKMHIRYPKLIQKKKDGSFEFLVSFFQRSDRLEYLFGISQTGADAMKNIYDLYVEKNKNGLPCLYSSIQKKAKSSPLVPVILIFDNEQITKRPLKVFLSHIGKADILKTKCSECIRGNLFVVTNPLVKGLDECEIEDLFSDELLDLVLDGKTFDRKGSDSNTHFGKAIFAKYVAENYSFVDFSEFVPFLDTINQVILDFPNPKIGI